MKNAKIINPDPNGYHALVELHGCNKIKIDSLTYLQETIEKIILKDGLDILDQKFEKFSPYGVTGILLLSASHVSIHTWPEIGYCTIDVFTCSGSEITNNIYTGIVSALQHSSSKINVIKRGYEYETPKYLRELLVFSTGEMMSITIIEEITKLINPYQKIEIVNTSEFGKCLLINDVMQLSERDHHLYDNALINMLTLACDNILILGGGDGFIAKTIVERYPDVKNITIVDIDPDVVRVCNEIFHNNNLSKKITFTFKDVNEYLRDLKTIKYDYIICDLTDDPVGIDQEDFILFYTTMFEQIVKKSENGTTIAVQAGTPEVCEGVDSYAMLTKLARKYGKNTTTKLVDIPSFGEEAAFVFFKT